MAVYVDDLNLQADVPDGARVVRGRWCHLFADTEDELRAFAKEIGLRESWIQHPGQPRVHFDVTRRMRQRATAAGATPVTWRQAGEFFAQRARQAPTPVDSPPAAGTQPGTRHDPPAPAAHGQGRDGDRGAGRARALRQAAHLYLGHGLLPVPGWAARASGACCCPRGVACPRPGKHPRSVHAGPGPRDYSWKPLACRTHAEVDQRFGDGGEYAGANLMLAIPPGMLVIDRDDDDGGRQAIATLAAHLGDLPATLAHRTPHGVHRIYRTPPGWAGRGWVGKDARNPLPAGVDLRVPGQILMAPPSQVPVAGGLASYGPVTGAAVTDLPAAYLAAWTPAPPQPVRPHTAVPVPPDRAGAAAAYVHAKVEGIIADLAAHEPGGRNTAIYTAALKVGSTLGAARTTPGGEHTAAGWAGQAAEDALMEAAEANGYISKHGAAMARSAIRSGLRNGLRHPRPLPDFTANPTATPPTRDDTQPQAAPATGGRDPGQAQPAPAARPPGEGSPVGHGRSARARQASRREAPTARSVAAVLRTAGYPASSRGPAAAYGPEGYQAHAAPGGGVLIRHVAMDEPINGVTPPARIDRMLTAYGHALRDAGFHVTSPTPGCLAVTPQPAGQHVPQPPAPATPGQGNRTRASEAAVAANQAYRAGEFGRARRLIDQAAELDPARTGLWDRHRTEIAAKQLFAQARAAAAEGNQDRAGTLLDQARELDPRMQGLWDRHLTGIRSRHLIAGHAAGSGRDHYQPAREPARERRTGPETGPQSPSRVRGAQAESSVPAKTRSEPQPAGSGDRPGTAAPPDTTARPEHPRARHSWQPAGEGTRRCTREDCSLVARRRMHPTERRWLTSYTKNGRIIVAERVPACGENLPQGLDTGQRRDLATDAARHAGHAFRSGDIDRAYRLLTDARALDPDRQKLWDQHEAQIRKSVAERQPRQASHSTETAPCPHCGEPYARPIGETYPCLSCETQTRLKAAGFTPGSAEIKRIAEWNQTAIHGADRRRKRRRHSPAHGPGKKQTPR